MNTPDDPGRGTGRTTARMLQAIAAALLAPDQWVEFIDHAPQDKAAAKEFAYCLHMICHALEIHLRIRRDAARVFLLSPISELRRKPR
jgi:hypothetical protein